jgi:hypothetical protein
MLDYFQSANYTPTVQPLVMMTKLINMKALLICEITFNQKLAREVVIPRERA